MQPRAAQLSGVPVPSSTAVATVAVWCAMSAVTMDRSATALCDSLEDIRTSVLRQVWWVPGAAASGGRGAARAGRGDDGTASPTRHADDQRARMQERRALSGKVSRGLRAQRAAYSRNSGHPVLAAAAADLGLGARASYTGAAHIAYPRELRHDGGVLTRARRQRAAVRRAASAGAVRVAYEPEPERQSIELAISCSQLEGVASKQPLGKGSKLAVCVEARLLLWRGEQWQMHGTTEAVRDGESPAFAKTFVVAAPLIWPDSSPRAGVELAGPSWEAGGLRCRVELHYRWGQNATDSTQPAAGEALLGAIEFPLHRLMDTPGRCLATRLEPSGRLAVRGVPVEDGLHEQATVRLRARLFNRPTDGLPFCSYFFTLAREIGASASALTPFELIARSEQIANRDYKSLGCRDLSLSAHKLCYGDTETRLMVSLFKYDPLGQHELIGEGRFSPAEALAYPPPMGAASSHLSRHTLSALDVSCVSDTSLNTSSFSRRSTVAVVDASDDEIGDGIGAELHAGVDKSKVEDEPQPEPEPDPFSVLSCPLYGDQHAVGTLRVSLGLSTLKELSSSIMSNPTGECTRRVSSSPKPPMAEAADADYLRTLMADRPLAHSDTAFLAEEALCHAEERAQASARFVELQRDRRSTATALSKSLKTRNVVHQQLPRSVARIVNESQAERDVRIFAVMKRGIDLEQRLRDKQAAAEEAGEWQSFLTLPKRRRQQQMQMERDLSEFSRERLSRGPESEEQQEEEQVTFWEQPVDAMTAALVRLNDAGATTLSGARTNPSTHRNGSGSRSGILQAHDPSGILAASLLFTEALSAQASGTADAGGIAQPNLLEISGRQPAPLSSGAVPESVGSAEGDSSGGESSPARKRPQRPRSADRSAGRGHRGKK